MLSFFPRDVLDEILDLIGSVSEGFPTYSYMSAFSYYRYECNGFLICLPVFVKCLLLYPYIINKEMSPIWFVLTKVYFSDKHQKVYFIALDV